MRKKLLQNSGETLVETLVAIVITVLSIGFLTSAVLASVNINKKVKDRDIKYKEDLQKAECLLDEDRINTNQLLDINFTYEEGSQNTVVKVDVYGEENGIFVSYTYEPEVSP
ncbi:MAG: type II secretion system protein [Roseburia sp.]|nr:type II secretion system protein [Roseburia sp.]